MQNTSEKDHFQSNPLKSRWRFNLFVSFTIVFLFIVWKFDLCVAFQDYAIKWEWFDLVDRIEQVKAKYWHLINTLRRFFCVCFFFCVHLFHLHNGDALREHREFIEKAIKIYLIVCVWKDLMKTTENYQTDHFSKAPKIPSNISPARSLATHLNRAFDVQRGHETFSTYTHRHSRTHGEYRAMSKWSGRKKEANEKKFTKQNKWNPRNIKRCEALNFGTQSEYVDFFLFICNEMRFPFGYAYNEEAGFILFLCLLHEFNAHTN